MADMPALEPEAKISVATAAYDPILPSNPQTLLSHLVEFDEEDRAPETAYSISEQNPESQSLLT